MYFGLAEFEMYSRAQLYMCEVFSKVRECFDMSFICTHSGAIETTVTQYFIACCCPLEAGRNSRYFAYGILKSNQTRYFILHIIYIWYILDIYIYIYTYSNNWLMWRAGREAIRLIMLLTPKFIFIDEHSCILVHISQKCVPNGSI